MRFMMIVKANKDSEAGKLPSPEMIETMNKYNEELIKAGVMVDGVGLHSSAKGARIQFSGNKKTVIDGPFAETKELIAGFWIIKVNSKQEAIDWALKAPNPHGEGAETNIELRQFFEMEEFGESEAVDKARDLEKKLKSQKK
jgi:hypothetical protein